MNHITPRWLDKLERPLGFIAIHNIAIILVTLQVAGLFLVFTDPSWWGRLSLVPQAVMRGEIWRIVTFLGLPLSTNPLLVLFAVGFFYFLITTLESLWGAFKTTFYILISWLVTLVFAFSTGFPVMSAWDFESTLFLAAAAMMPEYEIRLFLFLPVKMKWLAAITGVSTLLNFIAGPTSQKLYLLAIFSNYLIFFGAYHFRQVKILYRQWKNRNNRFYH